MKKPNPIMRKLYPISGSILTFLAITLTVKPASIFTLYQPKTPKSIK